MNDLFDYFISPTKSKKSPESEKQQSLSPKIEKTSCSPKSKGLKAKRRKRKRKPTDPEVRSVAELFASMLKVASPRESECSRSDSNVSNSSDALQPSSNDDLTVESALADTPVPSPAGSNSSSTSPKMDAFQLLMKSQSKVIGQNSGGKVIENKELSPESNRRKTIARKKLFKEWSEQKGALKRQREEEEVENCINVKMEERTKRLRSMLLKDTNNGNLSPKKNGQRTPKKDVRRTPKKNRQRTPKKNGQRTPKKNSNKTPTKNTIDRYLSSEYSNDSSTTNSSLSHEDHSQNFAGSPKSVKKSQNGLLNFLGVIDSMQEDDIQVFDNVPETSLTKEVIKIKMFTTVKTNRKKKDCHQKAARIKKREKENISKNRKIHKADNDKQENPDDRNNKSPEVNLDNSMKDFCSPDSMSNNTKLRENCKAKERAEEHTLDTLKIESSKSAEESVTTGRVLRKRTTVDYKSMLSINLTKSSAKKDKGASENIAEKRNKSSKKRKEIQKTDDSSVEKIELSSDEEPLENRKNFKIAPVFSKAAPKPKLSQEALEAKKKFLLSGVPETLKKTVQKQKSFSERVPDLFPLTSHIQQRCSSTFWNLPPVEINYTELSEPLPRADNLLCTNLITKSLSYKVDVNSQVEKLRKLKDYIREIKTDNPDYPVFKVFNQLSRKNSICSSVKNKKAKSSSSLKSPNKRSNNLKIQEMWTEKYKPRSSEEILGNQKSIKALKEWMEMWTNYSKEINGRKRKRADSDSESDFASTDGDSRDSTRLPGNTLIIYGPCSSGKTSAVYAVANELQLSVLELNASTKRTGKILLQELQEATRSHQVRKTDNALTSFVNPSKKLTKSNSQQDDNCSKKMCILLMEDIDLIFPQDEGFLSSLSQLILTSKRPMILTATDKSLPHIQRFLNQYECIHFTLLSQHCLAVWLQIVCLIENVWVDKDDVGNLLEYNKGDIRKTLLELQYWCQSGGQLEKQRNLPLVTSACNEKPDLREVDDELQMVDSGDEPNCQERFVHRNCLASFELFRNEKEYLVPRPANLGTVWWNFSKLLDIPTSPGRTDEKRGLSSLLKVYESVIMADCLHKAVRLETSMEPVVLTSSKMLLDSLILTERMEDLDWANVDLVEDMSHLCVNNSLEEYIKNEGGNWTLNMALPDSAQRRWRADRLFGKAYLQEPIPLSNVLNRKSVTLDYVPALREINRLEERRLSANTKRGNRFRHYMKDLNISFNPKFSKLAYETLQTD